MTSWTMDKKTNNRDNRSMKVSPSKFPPATGLCLPSLLVAVVVVIVVVVIVIVAVVVAVGVVVAAGS